MNLKTIQEYYPRFRTVIGDYLEIDDLQCDLTQYNSKDIRRFFNHYDNEINIVYLKDGLLNFVIFRYRNVAAYLSFGEYDDFYLLFKEDYNNDDYTIFDPFKNDNDSIILVADKGNYENLVKEVKIDVIEKYNLRPSEVFCSFEELERFCLKKIL